MRVRLFDRRANGLTLAPAGQALLPGLSAAFDSIAEAVRSARELAEAPPVLVVGVGPTFAGRWLIPRLRDFGDTNPDIEIRLATGGPGAPYREDWTCAIRLGAADWPGFEARPLFEVDLMVVCSPALARRIRCLDDLARGPSITVATQPDDWQRWWRAAAGGGGAGAHGPTFDSYDLALRAAVEGQGVALVPELYAAEDLDAGRLVEAIPQRVPKGMGWHLIYRAGRATDPVLERFSAWIERWARLEERSRRVR